MATIRLETTLDVAPDKLWAQVRDVGGISNLLGIITKSSVDGDTRSCTMADGGELTETILGIDESKHRVDYTITDSPFPIESHSASMEVEDAGGGKSTFRWVTNVTPDELAAGFEPMLAGEISSLEERFGT